MHASPLALWKGYQTVLARRYNALLVELLRARADRYNVFLSLVWPSSLVQRQGECENRHSSSSAHHAWLEGKRIKGKSLPGCHHLDLMPRLVNSLDRATMCCHSVVLGCPPVDTVIISSHQTDVYHDHDRRPSRDRSGGVASCHKRELPSVLFCQDDAELTTDWISTRNVLKKTLLTRPFRTVFGA